MTLHPGALRSPYGFVFVHEGRPYIQVNRTYEDQYNMLMESGLFDTLAIEGYLNQIQESGLKLAQTDDAYRVLVFRMLPFVAYPFEWSFNQWKDVALKVLDVQQKALEHGMSLNNTSAFFWQFFNGKPILVNPLVFEPFEEGRGWGAYRQFLRHFVAPLALMANTDIRIGRLLRSYPNGIPLSLASKMLPVRSRMNFGLLQHIHNNADEVTDYAGNPVDILAPAAGSNMKSMLELLDTLGEVIRNLNWKPEKDTWTRRFMSGEEPEKNLAEKRRIVTDMLYAANPVRVWDLNAGDGTFTRIAVEGGRYVAAWDADPGAVDALYQSVLENDEGQVIPFWQDLGNPSPALGWAHREARSFGGRSSPDLLMAMEFISHIAIGQQVPLDQMAAFLARLAPWLIIEFIPKTDPKAIAYLKNRLDTYPGYSREGFEAAFGQYYDIVQKHAIGATERVIYLLYVGDAPA